MEENQNAIYKGNANCGFTSGVIELYADKLVFISNKGKTNVYEYNNITKIKDTLGCLEVTTADGKVDTFGIDKDLRLKMIDYLNEKQVFQTNIEKANIDTDKIKEQFKNVSNNVVENVKNFDKEQAKQQTISFANNVKTDVKNFKTLSTKKKRNYIIALVVIILVVFIAGKGILGIGGANNSGTKDDAVLITEAFKKWIDTDKQANLLYHNNNCVWEGKISGRNGDTVSVYLILYDKNIYNQLKNLGQDTSGAKLFSGTVQVPKK